MVETLEGMPAGTVGFRATGKLTRADYDDRFIPAIEEAVKTGEVRMLYVIGPGFDGIESGALVEDAKAGFSALKHHSAWKRTAVATDEEWIRKGVHLFAWMVPGEVRVFDVDDVDAAKEWLAG